MNKVAKKSDVATETGRMPARPTRMQNPFEEMERIMFENFLPRGWMRPMHLDRPFAGELALETKVPKVDVVDRDEEVLIKAEVPGVDKKDLEVTMTDNSVTIRGSTSREKKEEKGNYYRCEISRGSFSRTVALPSDVDSSKARTSYKDGVLEITAPKVVKAKRRTLAID